jgi:uncharacterized protein (TIGR00290 family)
MQNTNKKQKTLLSWSSGKDSAWALYQLQKDPDIQLLGLFTSVNEQYQRVAMHAVRQELLVTQAKALGLPLEIIPIPSPCSNEEYEQIMKAFVERCKEQAIECFAFGDLYLEDIRDYRIAMLANTGIEPYFPLWNIPTGTLATQMVESGLKAHITCIDPRVLAPSFVGRKYQDVLTSFPDGVDICGENGEFHTFVYDGPMFKHPVDVETGVVVERDGFIFSDLTLKRDSD